jgi:hypothetical protein
MRARVRARWRNHTRNQGIDPLRRCTPQSLDELVDLVREAESEGVTVRAVGSGHSWSDCALTTGFLVEPGGLTRALEPDLLRSGVDAGRLARVESGMRVRELNEHLDARGLALAVMGGYDGQTVAGVVSTATHGSGIEFGPIADSVRSIDLVASRGKVWRIERADGPTDAAAYAERYPDRELVQEDEVFDAAVVGIGCMGLIYSLTLAVVPAFCLTEVRRCTTWGELRESVRSRKLLGEHDHVELFLNPYGERRLLITTRNRTDEKCPGRGRRGRRNLITELLASLPFVPALLNLAADLFPARTPWMLDMAVKGLADREYTHKSYRVFNIGRANDIPAYSSEIGVPVDDRGLHVEAIDRICEVADRHRRLGSVYQTSPISLRFVRASPAHMAMMSGRDTMMIELIMMTRTEGGYELLAAYEDALYELEGRPHWGQVNTLSGGHDRVASLYPDYGRWLAVHGRLNESGVFDSPFGKRVGISARSAA